MDSMSPKVFDYVKMTVLSGPIDASRRAGDPMCSQIANDVKMSIQCSVASSY